MPRPSSTYVSPGPVEFALRCGDRLPSLVVDLIDDSTTAVDLTGVSGISPRVYWMRRRISGIPNDGESPGWTMGKQMLIVGDPTLGIVYYDWQTADTNDVNPGAFDLMFYVEFLNASSVVTGTLVVPSLPTCRLLLRPRLDYTLV